MSSYVVFCDLWNYAHHADNFFLLFTLEIYIILDNSNKKNGFVLSLLATISFMIRGVDIYSFPYMFLCVCTNIDVKT